MIGLFRFCLIPSRVVAATAVGKVIDELCKYKLQAYYFRNIYPFRTINCTIAVLPDKSWGGIYYNRI
jgi:hypothetical protein